MVSICLATGIVLDCYMVEFQMMQDGCLLALNWQIVQFCIQVCHKQSLLLFYYIEAKLLPFFWSIDIDFPH